MAGALYKYIKTLIVFTWLAIVFIATVEVCMRIEDKIKYDAPLLANYSYDRLINHDSEGLQVNVQNSQFEKWKINRLGFRGPDLSEQKDRRTIRVVCMGSSETFGLYENPNKEWPAQLKAMLNKDWRIEIINTSVPGLFLYDYKAYIQKYVLRIEPDIVILHVNPLMYARHTKKGIKQGAVGQQKDRLNDHLQATRNRLPSLRALPKIKQLMKGSIPGNLLKKYQVWDMGRQVAELEERNRLLGIKTEDSVRPERINYFMMDLISLIRYLTDMKIKVVLSSYPTLLTTKNVSEYLNISLDARRYCAELSFAGMIDASLNLNNGIRSVAEITRTGFVDNEMTVSKNLRYFADNVHYTDEGAKVIALNYYQYLMNSIPFKQ